MAGTLCEVLPLWGALLVGAMQNSVGSPVKEHIPPKPQKEDPGKSGQSTETNETTFSEVEDENPREADLLLELERKRQMSQLQAKLFQLASEGAVHVKGRGPHWGSGLTVIDNLGQMTESLGYNETQIFVFMISIWNFLGCVGGGYFSEIVVRDYAYPRPVAMAIAQVSLAIGHFFLAMAWPGATYVSTLLVGLGYGAHWAIVPATLLSYLA